MKTFHVEKPASRRGTRKRLGIAKGSHLTDRISAAGQTAGQQRVGVTVLEPPL